MNPDFDQNLLSGATKGIFRIEYHCIRLEKWMAYFDRRSESINNFDLTASVLSAPDEISEL